MKVFIHDVFFCSAFIRTLCAKYSHWVKIDQKGLFISTLKLCEYEQTISKYQIQKILDENCSLSKYL